MYFIGRQFFFLTIKTTRTKKTGIIKLAQNSCAAAKVFKELLHATWCRRARTIDAQFDGSNRRNRTRVTHLQANRHSARTNPTTSTIATTNVTTICTATWPGVDLANARPHLGQKCDQWPRMSWPHPRQG
jgi:hypothetical protein